MNITTIATGRGVSQPYLVPVATIWSKLPEVYAELDIPVTTIIAAQHEIGNASLRIRRSLAGQRLSRYLNCGSSMGEQNADTYQVTMAIVSRVSQNREGHTILTTTVEGNGSATAASSHRGVVCTSTGELERRIEQMVRDRV